MADDNAGDLHSRACGNADGLDRQDCGDVLSWLPLADFPTLSLQRTGRVVGFMLLKWTSAIIWGLLYTQISLSIDVSMDSDKLLYFRLLSDTVLHILFQLLFPLSLVTFKSPTPIILSCLHYSHQGPYLKNALVSRPYKVFQAHSAISCLLFQSEH